MKHKKGQLTPEELNFRWFVFLLFIIFLLGWVLGGCASLPTQPLTPPPPKYQLLLTGTIDGTAFEGVGVGSSATHHDMQVFSPVEVDYFTVQSCHRAQQFNGVIKYPWYVWFESNRGFAWSYDEAPTIEDTGDCILRFCAFSKVIGSPPVACAIVDFKSDRYTLPSTNICNDVVGAATGTAICHTQVGLLERLQFQGPTVMAPQLTSSDPTKPGTYWITNQCQGKFIDDAQTLFEYTVPENECSSVFMEKTLQPGAQKRRRAKLTVIPYDLPRYQGVTQQ